MMNQTKVFFPSPTASFSMHGSHLHASPGRAASSAAHIRRSGAKRRAFPAPMFAAGRKMAGFVAVTKTVPRPRRLHTGTQETR